MSVSPAAAPALHPAPAPRSAAAPPGAITGAPRLILRLEGAAVLGLAAAAYGRTGAGWGVFALLFLLPDLSMLGYLAGPRIGAMSYNFAHSYLPPALVLALGAFGGMGALAPPGVLFGLGLIWAAHIGFDRMLGYGLKHPTAFGHTHLGVVGAKTRAA